MASKKNNVQPDYKKIVDRIKLCLVNLNNTLDEADASGILVEIWLPSNKCTINTGEDYDVSVMGTVVFCDED